ncbi:MAG: hypothetical protein K2K92_08410, partial [Duncaniella sp.]|nr:hypothetical protein [Duncaniella sp.]
SQPQPQQVTDHVPTVTIAQDPATDYTTPQPQAHTPVTHQAPSHPAPARAAHTAPVPPRQAVVGRRAVRKAGVETFSIASGPANNTTGSTQVPTTSSQTPASQRISPYTIEQLHKAWQSFMSAHPTHHILINTMRASFPTAKDQAGAPHSYVMMVENEKQREEMLSHLPEIHSMLHDSLDNDLVSITVELNQGEASPHTWNERQVLQHMLDTNPEMRSLVESFQLTIG